MLIKTKFNMPPLRSKMLDRTHLIDKLSEGKSNRILLVMGQAGSGKTSLVSQWAVHHDLPVAWYSLDETDNEPDLFYRYMLTTLGNNNNKLAEGFGPFLQSRRKLLSKDVFPFVIDCLGDLADDLYLILDDYHLITSEAIHEAVSYLIRYLPPKIHVGIISRQKVPFSLSSFRIRNQITEVFASDLLLTEVESKRFLSEIMSLNLSSDQLQELTRYAEGWIGGLQMIGLSLFGKDNLASLKDILASAGRITAEYLIDEVIKVQPEEVRNFIFYTVLLNKFNTELCEHVTGMKNVSEILAYLCKTNLFLVPLNAECTWYRYHNLFSESLGARRNNSSSPKPSEIHRTAALWFAKNNYLEDAFQQSFATNDYEFAADMLEEYLYHFFERYDVAGALRWISKLPRSIFMQRTLLRLDECTFKVLSQELEDLEAVLNEIEKQKEEAFKRYTGHKKRRCKSILSYLQCRLPYYRDPATVNVNHLIECFKKISNEDQFFHGTIETVIAQCGLYQGKVLLAEKTLKDATANVLSSRSTFRKIHWYKSIAEVELWKGNLKRVEASVENAFKYLTRNDIDQVPLRYFLYLPMATVYYLRNDLENALDFTSMCIRYAMQAKHVKEIIAANFLLAQIYLAIGEPENVRKCIQTMQNTSIGNPQGSMASAEAYIALLSLANGDIIAAEKWSKRRKIRENEKFSICYFFESLAHALLKLQQKEYSEAVRFLKTLHNRCITRNMMLAVLQVDLLYSSALYASGQHEQAKKMMEKSVSFAETEGYIRVFVDYWQFISPILQDISRKPLHISQNRLFFMKILEACGIAADSEIQTRLSDTDSANLSKRELDILKLLASGYRNKEIAHKAFISLDTVKTHVRHIFQKLEVNTRIQAVAKAKELKLF